ncbi:hypothetical protein AB5J72_00150 [Streptomyces sp. CG1]|uniref:hypothetical protein n=1 Tax=Streptomyces sp. CG1 TaxID=1287523 RepID=UPI0034E19FF0
MVASLRESGMSYPAISAATGMSVGTAHATAQGFKFESLLSRTRGADGKSYAARTPEVVDAELVNEPTHPEPPKGKWRPLPEA